MFSAKKTIFLNAGHSDIEPGAKVANNEFENEAQLNVIIRDFLIPELKEQGFEVISIPDHLNFVESYLSVNKKALKLTDGLALDIHFNCCEREGAEAYYVSYSATSETIAQKLIDGYCDITGIKNGGVVPDTHSYNGEISWLRKTNCWATLIECAYLDSNADMEIVFNNIPLVAKAIAVGICEIYGIQYKEDQSSQVSRLEIIQKIKTLLDKLL